MSVNKPQNDQQKPLSGQEEIQQSSVNRDSLKTDVSSRRTTEGSDDSEEIVDYRQDTTGKKGSDAKDRNFDGKKGNR